MNSLLSIFLLLVALPLSSVMAQVPSDPMIDPPIIIVEPPVVDPPIDGGDEWADTDGDGITDDWELAYGLDPEDASDADVDTDGDGLTNVQEFEFGSDPTVADTDGGGASDYSEWVLSTAIQHVLDAVSVLVYQYPGSTGGTGGFIGNGSAEMQLNIILRPQFPIDPLIVDPETGDEEVTDPVDNDEEEATDDPVGFAAAPTSNDDSAGDDNDTGGDVTIDDPVIDPVVVIDPTKVLNALSELLGDFDPNDDADDETVTKAVDKLKELKLWGTVEDIATNKIDLTSLLWTYFYQPQIMYSMGASGGPIADSAGLDGGTSTDGSGTTAPFDPTQNNTPKAYNFGGGGSAGAPSTSDNSGGSKSADSAGIASSGGSGGGGSGSLGTSSSGSRGGSHSASASSAPAAHSILSISGSSGPQTVGSRSSTGGDADEHHHHHGYLGGGSDSSVSGSTGSHVSTAVLASTVTPATPSDGSTATGFAVMSLLSAAGWALRRFLTAAI